MSQLSTKSRHLNGLPRNWRVMTAAGVATLGLACGLARPALAELLKLPWAEKRASHAAAPATKAVPTENGFTATIRRLMAESNAHAERGEYDKAVQMAERAAKISEASAQVLGPTSECSPAETAKFANDMRGRRAAIANGSSLQTTEPRRAPEFVDRPTRQSPQPAATASTKSDFERRASQSTQLSAFAGSKNDASVAQPESGVPSSPLTFGERGQDPNPRLEAKSVPSASSYPPVFGPASAPTSQTAAVRPEVAAAGSQSMTRSSRQTPVPTARAPISSAGPTSRATVSHHPLLDQARQAASRGDLDTAIKLAEQARQHPTENTSLFGPSTSSSLAETRQFLTELRTHRDSLTRKSEIPKTEIPKREVAKSEVVKTAVVKTEDVFEPAFIVANSLQDEVPPSPADEPLDGDHTPLRRDQSEKKSSPLQEVSISENAPLVSEEASKREDSEWTEDPTLVPAPAAELQRSPLRFSRRVITHADAWDESVPGEVRSMPTETPRAANENEKPLREEEPAELIESTSSPPNAAVPNEAPVTEVTQAPIEPLSETGRSLATRQPIRLRGNIVQAGAQWYAPEPAHTADRTNDWKIAEPIADSPQKGASADLHQDESPSFGQEFSHANDDRPIEPRKSSESLNDVDVPVQRFPIQRVLRLRRRLDSATSLNPGRHISNGDSESHGSERPTEPLTPTQNKIPSARDFATESADAWHDASELETTTLPSPVAAASKSPKVKLRSRFFHSTEEELGSAEGKSTPVPRPARTTPRQPVIAHSEMVLWKSADSETPLPPSLTSGLNSIPTNDLSVDDRRSNSNLNMRRQAEMSPSLFDSEPGTGDGGHQPLLPPPVAQAAFESSTNDPSGSTYPLRSGDEILPMDRVADIERISRGEHGPLVAPPPPTDEHDPRPWNSDGSTGRSTASDSNSVQSRSFSMIDQLATTWKMPVATAVSIIGGAGLLLLGFGLLLLRAALWLRHSS